MKGNVLLSRNFLSYLFKFFLVFCLVYYGSQLIIGLTAPGNHYNEFVEKHLDYIAFLRRSLLYASNWVVSFFGYNVYVQSEHYLSIINGSRVRMVYSCLGIGVFSFWIAFVIANTGSFLRKLLWLSTGIILIWIINVIRVSLLLVAANDRWKSFLILNHHTLFNIAAYGCVFALIYFYDRSNSTRDSGNINSADA